MKHSFKRTFTIPPGATVDVEIPFESDVPLLVGEGSFDVKEPNHALWLRGVRKRSDPTPPHSENGLLCQQLREGPLALRLPWAITVEPRGVLVLRVEQRGGKQMESATVAIEVSEVPPPEEVA